LLDREITGEVLFESYAVDLSWGYRLSGWYIDASGAVWTYEHTGTPWYPEQVQAGELPGRDMVTKHEGARQVGTVDRALLHDMAQLIKPASRGPIAHAAEVGAGSGSLEVAYLYDPLTEHYHEIILRGRGGRVATNSAPEAQLLLDYLRDLQAALELPAPA
jgi:hypothetical protein